MVHGVDSFFLRSALFHDSTRASFMYNSMTINIVEILRIFRALFIAGPLISGRFGISFREFLRRGRQPPLILQMTFHRFEDDAIDYVADGDDQDHDGDDGAHVIKVAAHH